MIDEPVNPLKTAPASRARKTYWPGTAVVQRIAASPR